MVSNGSVLIWSSFGIWIVQATNQSSVPPPTHPMRWSFLVYQGFASASEPESGQLGWAPLPAQSSHIILG